MLISRAFYDRDAGIVPLRKVSETLPTASD
jgi:hypothetical protein